MKILSAGPMTDAAAPTLLATACGGGGGGGGGTSAPEDAAEGTMVVRAAPGRTGALAPFAERFGEAHGVTVDVQSVPNEDLQDDFGVLAVGTLLITVPTRAVSGSCSASPPGGPDQRLGQGLTRPEKPGAASPRRGDRPAARPAATSSCRPCPRRPTPWTAPR